MSLKIIIIAVTIFLVAAVLILLGLLASKNQGPAANIITSVFPPNGTSSVGIYQSIIITFSRPVTPQEQAQTRLVTTPEIVGNVTWSSDQKTMTLAPTTPILTGQAYQLALQYPQGSYDWQFTTVALNQVSQQDIAREQTQADKNFADWQANTQAQFPWLNKLPLQTSDYFVYFDVSTKEFTAKLYPTSTSSSSVDQQVAGFKQTITTQLAQLGIPYTNYKFNWDILTDQ